MHRKLIGAAVTAAALAALPAGAAQAATVSFSGGTLTITGGTEKNSIVVSASGDTLSVLDSGGGGARLAAGGGGGACTDYDSSIGDDFDAVECNASMVKATSVSLGAGDDVYRNEVDGIADTVNGGEGNDALRGAVGGSDPAADTIRGDGGIDEVWAGTGDGTTCEGGEGNDTLWCSDVPAGRTAHLRGGGGNDTIYGGASNDAIDGGEGDDVMTGRLGADDIRGGNGHDRFQEDRASGTTMLWSIDDVANDGGANGGEGDNIRTDVEELLGSSANDVMVGSAGPDVLKGQLGDDDLKGLGGDDVLDGGVAGADRADGGDGNDTVVGRGHLLGGAGNDSLRGESDDGLLEPGAGRDTVAAGGGNDVVRAIDGEVDTIGCGAGADVAEVDGADVVNTADPGNICEEVRRGTATSGGQSPNGNPNAGAVALILGRAGSFKGSVASFRATAPGAGRISVTVTAAPARASAAARKRKAVVLGRATKTVSRAGKVTLKVKLKGKAAKRLKRKRSFKVKLVTVFTPKGGKAGPKATRTVTLKRRR